MQSSLNGEKEQENIGTGFFVRESIIVSFIHCMHVCVCVIAPFTK